MFYTFIPSMIVLVCSSLCSIWTASQGLKILFLNCYSVTVVPIFPPLPSSAQPAPCTLPAGSQFPQSSLRHCPCMWVIHTCSLTSLSPSFYHYPLSLSPPFHVSLSLVLFCSLVYSVYQIPLINEILWYLSFSFPLSQALPLYSPFMSCAGSMG